MITLRDYLNVHKALRFVDRHDLEAEGLKLSDVQWGRFANHPTRWLIEASELDAEFAWRALQAKMRE